MHARVLLILLLALLPACSFHSVATHWNGRVDDSGHPVYIRTVTNVGLNIFVLLPVAGNTTLDSMIDETTEAIAKQQSDHVRVITATTTNYWDAIPVICWIITPVITTVTAEYRPSEAEIRATVAANERLAEKAKERRQHDQSHILPGPRK